MLFSTTSNMLCMDAQCLDSDIETESLSTQPIEIPHTNLDVSRLYVALDGIDAQYQIVIEQLYAISVGGRPYGIRRHVELLEAL